ncbi:hypothetical protein [Enteractinococcus helveticum]|uniref:Uncharacterized protein n=1 Tax=Enteractinococcus helveticum TaxID=1837282 RepID=A0A1B7M3F8_9MICC|nr:hypothetical protein [Enteractinococcus helveticum]OAV63127.1 hypothetical protein A6F49_02950 [Enteractinococcus helveticum]
MTHDVTTEVLELINTGHTVKEMINDVPGLRISQSYGKYEVTTSNMWAMFYRYHRNTTAKDKTMTIQLRQAVEALDLRQLNLRDMIELARRHGVMTSKVAEFIEQYHPENTH